MGWFKDIFAPDTPTRLRKKRTKDPAIMARLGEQERTFFLLRSNGHDLDTICSKMNITKDAADYFEFKLLKL